MKRSNKIIVVLGVIALVCIVFYCLTQVEEVPNEPICGDGICDQDYENESNCPDDCGCNNNGICEPDRGETVDNCPDCEPDPVICNDNEICEPELGETEDNCGDCGCDDDDECEPLRGETRFNCEDCVDRPPEEEGVGFRLPSLDKKIGETFWISVYVDPGADNIATFILDMSYDSSILSYKKHVGVNDWEDWFFVGDTSTLGKILFCQSMDIDGQSQKDVILRIQFMAIAEGDAQLSFDSVEFEDLDSDPVDLNVNNGTITIYGI